MTPLSQITQLGTGCGLGSTQVEVRAFVKTIPFQNKGRSSAFHIFKVADPETGFECESKFWNRDVRDIPVHQVIEIADAPGSKRPGLTVGEDKNGNAQLSVSESCEIAFIEGGRQPHRQQAPTQPQRQYQQQPQQTHQQAPQQRQTYQQPQRPAPQQNAQQTRPTTNLGVTVGMALNNACNMVKDGHPPEYFTSPAFSLDVWTIASDILRVSRMLESDNLADPAKVRHAPRQPQQQRQAAPQHQEHDLPADAEVTRPSNTTEPPSYADTGLENDDIPW